MEQRKSSSNSSISSVSSTSESLSTKKESLKDPAFGWRTTKSKDEDTSTRLSRFVRNQKAIPKRPTSPHLALGHRSAPQPPTFSKDATAVEKKRATQNYLKEKKEYIKTRGDQLEMLIARKIFAHQHLQSKEHKLSTCHVCTTGAYLNDNITPKSFPGCNHHKNHKNPYLYQNVAYKHVQDPNPRRPQYVLGSKARKPGACMALERSSTWRAVDELAGAGRLPQKKGFSLPNQRSSNQTDTKKDIAKYFAYFDLDDSGEMSLDELRKTFTTMLNFDPGEDIMKELLRRFDVDGDGKIEYSEIAERIITVANVPDGHAIPSGGLKGQRSNYGEEDAEYDQQMLEEKVSRIEKKWVLRLSQKSKYLTPTALQNCFERCLETYVNSSGKVKKQKLLDRRMGNEEEMTLLAARYQQSLSANVDRMMKVFEGEVDDIDRMNLPPPQDVTMSAQRRGLKEQTASNMTTKNSKSSNRNIGVEGDDSEGDSGGNDSQSETRKMEKLIVATLRVRMTEDSHREMRRVVKDLFRECGDDGEMTYDNMQPPIKSLLHKMSPPQKTIDRYIRYLDKDKRGVINIKDLTSYFLKLLNSATKLSKYDHQKKGGGDGSNTTALFTMSRPPIVKLSNKEEAINSFEKSLADVIYLRARQPNRQQILAITKNLFDKFATKRHEGRLVVEFDDEKKRKIHKSRSTFDIEVISHEQADIQAQSSPPSSSDIRGSKLGKGGVNDSGSKSSKHGIEEESQLKKESSRSKRRSERYSSDGSKKMSAAGYFIVMEVARSCIQSRGNWELVDGKGVYWVGEDEPLKEGDIVTFTSLSLLTISEFILAIKTLFPDTVSEDAAALVASSYANKSQVITMDHIAHRAWKRLQEESKLEFMR